MRSENNDPRLISPMSVTTNRSVGSGKAQLPELKRENYDPGLKSSMCDTNRSVGSGKA